jgi:hypothetical protein
VPAARSRVVVNRQVSVRLGWLGVMGAR